MWICGVCSVDAASTTDLSRPIQPGEPGVRPFWNRHALRFIYAPAFEFAPVDGSKSYRFTVHDAGGKDHTFTADKPWAALSPVWHEIPEGYTRLTVDGVDADGKSIAKCGERAFYRSPGFSGDP